MIVRWMNKAIELASPEPLLDILRRHEIYFPLYCGGNGQCGKCLIRVLEGCLAVTESDRQYLTDKQIQEGYRLGCQVVITESCTIEPVISGYEEDFFIPTVSKVNVSEKNNIERSIRYGIAVDIGTTTIVMVLVDLQDGRICSEYTSLNHQRSYGTDVMLRIQVAMDGKAKELQVSIRRDLAEGFSKLSEAAADNIESIAIAGNTTMLHLLRGYDCTGLGSYPFQPVSLSFEKISLAELLGSSLSDDGMEKLEDAKVTLLPGISSFIGSDITAGLLGCGMAQAEKPRLFLDLGTNAEMVVGCKGRLVATSAAAGPAFEGGQLSCGTGSIPGAIKTIKMQYGLVRYETIGRRPPTGICGSGVVAGIAELLRNKGMLTDGTLVGKYASGIFEIVPGRVAMNQQDIREVQKAKAAIRVGLDILVGLAGYRMEEIEQFELAGGFGSQLDVASAVAIGLIPEELSNKVHLAGNTVIAGLIDYLKMEDQQAIEEMVSTVKTLSMANHPEFIQKYLGFIEFIQKK